jgi:hypothetical protein
MRNTAINCGEQKIEIAKLKKEWQENNFLSRRNKLNLNAEQNYRIKETRDHETKHVRERNKATVQEQIKFNGIK